MICIFYSLIINECLNLGTQISYIRKAINKGYGVIVLNTNDNFTPNGKKIPNSGTAEEHAQYVWETYISKTSADSILIVAHSYGGVVTLALAEKTKDFKKRVKAVAFTDSVHAFSNNKVPNYLIEVCLNISYIEQGTPKLFDQFFNFFLFSRLPLTG